MEGKDARHVDLQQTEEIKELNFVQTQDKRAQFRGSSSRWENILRVTSSESFEKVVSAIDDDDDKDDIFGGIWREKGRKKGEFM